MNDIPQSNRDLQPRDPASLASTKGLHQLFCMGQRRYGSGRFMPGTPQARASALLVAGAKLLGVHVAKGIHVDTQRRGVWLDTYSKSIATLVQPTH